MISVISVSVPICEEKRRIKGRETGINIKKWNTDENEANEMIIAEAEDAPTKK